MFRLTLGQAQVCIAEQPLAFDGLLSAFPHYDIEAGQRFASAKRRSEWLSVRVLLHEALGPDVRLVYDKTGKPRIEGAPLHVSVSHSGPYAAIALSPSPVGLDIELAAARAERMKARFATEAELRHLAPVDIWCAKEAVYKLFPLPSDTPLTAVRIDSPERAECLHQSARLYFSRHESLYLCVAEAACDDSNGTQMNKNP